MKAITKTALLAIIATVFKIHAGEITLGAEAPNAAQPSFFAGIDTARGWAISSAGVARVELWIDGQLVSVLPQGGLRPDVAQAFPNAPGAPTAGYAAAVNFAPFVTGEVLDWKLISTVAIKPATIKVFDNDNAVAEQSMTIGVTRFAGDPQRFITREQAQSGRVNTSGITCSSTDDGRSFIVVNVIVDGVTHNIGYSWNENAQQFTPRLIAIQDELTGTQPASVTNKQMQSHDSVEHVAQ